MGGGGVKGIAFKRNSNLDGELSALCGAETKPRSPEENPRLHGSLV